MARITKRTMDAARRAERDTIRSQQRPPLVKGKTGKRTRDSYQNFALNLGIGTDNALSGSTYGFNPISRNRTLLEWMHRGSWLAAMAVDLPADDATRAGIDIICDADPEEIQDVQDVLTRTATWQGVRDTFAWGRLYGGAIGVIQIDGQDYSKPLDPTKIGKGQYRGVVSLDRWMVEPSLNDLVSEQGPYLGLPKFYRVTSDIPGLRMKIIHYTRVIRCEGVRLPYWQRVSENLWGISVIERLYDRMVAFDSATQGASQLAYKSYLRTIKIDGLREIIAEGGQALAALAQYVDMMRRFQGIEGMTMLDKNDEFEPGNATNMTGMSEVMLQLGQQLSGALQIPLVRLFGQSPAGLNSTGESDLRTYYDGINQSQNNVLMVPMHVIVRAAALSEGRKLPDKFKIVFRPLWQLSEEQKSEVASRDTETVLKAEERGVVSQQVALKELKQTSKITGRFTNVTDEDIEAASDELAPRGEEAIAQERESMEHQSSLEGASDQSQNDPKRDKEPKKFKDNLPLSELHGIPVAVECLRGTIRRGEGWSVVMPADYGYIRRAPSAEGETEWLDCFIGPDRTNAECHVVDAYDPLGKFDEHKVMLAFPTPRAALECYHAAYNDGRRAGAVTTMTPEELRAWYTGGDVTRPLAPRNLRLAANVVAR